LGQPLRKNFARNRAAGAGPLTRPRSAGPDALVNANTRVRSVYLPIVRDLLPDALAAFDFPEPSLVTGARETTNVPSQALYLLNSPFVAVQAQVLGERVVSSYPAGPNGGASANLDERISYAYWLIFCRPPSAGERVAAMNFSANSPRPGARATRGRAVSATRKRPPPLGPASAARFSPARSFGI